VPGKRRWSYYGKGVLDEVGQAPPEVREDFFVLLFHLCKNPTDPSSGVLQLKPGTVQPWLDPTHPWAGAITGHYMALFKYGILTYSVLADYPGQIHLVHITWDNKTW
jgi:hypothetical protein